jgi:hypothetical protein
MTNPTNDEYQNFYAAIGRGITLWAEIENKLSLVYSYLVFDTSQAAQDSFYSVGTFRAKLNLVDVASRSGFMRMENMTPAMPRIKTWNNLKNRLERLSKYRNKLAHYRVTLYGTPKEAGQSNVVDVSKLDYELRLCRPHIPTIKPSKEGIEAFSKQVNDTFSLPEIHVHISEVNNILLELKAFSEPLFYELGAARLKQINELHKQISEKQESETNKTDT